VKTSHTNGIILGISGGVDSALVANIAALSHKIKVVGV
jgi:NH3-dependent NAD+ synthetase